MKEEWDSSFGIYVREKPIFLVELQSQEGSTAVKKPSSKIVE